MEHSDDSTIVVHLPGSEAFIVPRRRPAPDQPTGEPPAKKLKTDFSNSDNRNLWVNSPLAVPAYSDITIYVGTYMKEFKLHRLVICTQSGWFKHACENNVKERQGFIIYLPEVDDSVFLDIVNWVYCGEFKITEHYDHDKIVKLFIAADDFQVQGLRSAILKSAKDYAMLSRRRLLEKDGKEFENPNIISLVNDLAKYAASSEYEEFREAVAPILARMYQPTKDEIPNGQVAMFPWEGFMSTVVASCYGRLLSDNMCGDCRISLALEKQKRCRMCHRDNRP